MTLRLCVYYETTRKNNKLVVYVCVRIEYSRFAIQINEHDRIHTYRIL